MVCKEDAVIHEQEVLGPKRDVVNEELEQEDTEGRAPRKAVAYIGEWAEAALESDRKGAVREPAVKPSQNPGREKGISRELLK